jgi:hypothetical protein
LGGADGLAVTTFGPTVVPGGQGDRWLRRQRIGLPRGVLVHVLLPRQLADLEHQLVGERAQDQMVVASVAVVACVDRPPDADDARPEGRGDVLAGGLDLTGPQQPDRHQGRSSP